MEIPHLQDGAGQYDGLKRDASLDLMLLTQNVPWQRQIKLIYSHTQETAVPVSKREDSDPLDRDKIVPLISISLRAPLEEVALSFFRSTFLTRASDAGAVVPDAQVQHMMKTVGLAALSGLTHATEMRGQTEKQYVAAVTATKQALLSSNDVTRDNVLFMVVLLGILEVLMGSSISSLQAWFNHVRGAMALIFANGAHHLRKPDNLRLFFQLTPSLLMTCLVSGEALPPPLFAFNNEVAKFIAQTDPVWRGHKASINTVDFRLRVQSGSIRGLSCLLHEAYAIDAELQRVLDHAHESWTRHTVLLEAPHDNIFGPWYYVYGHFLQSQICNGILAQRLILNDTIYCALRLELASVESEIVRHEIQMVLDSTSASIRSLQAELFASVPQYLGHSLNQQQRSKGGDFAAYHFPWTGFAPETSIEYTHQQPFARGVPHLRTAGGFFLIWYLYIAATTTPNSESARNYAIRILTIAAQDFGIKQALILAATLQGKPIDAPLHGNSFAS